MNNVVLSGRLTKNAEVRYGGEDGSVAIARFTLAVQDYKGTDFINIRALGKQAEWVEKWTGNKVYYTEVLANSVGFGESKAEAEARSGSRQQEEPQGSMTDADGFMNIPDGIDEELPFA